MRYMKLQYSLAVADIYYIDHGEWFPNEEQCIHNEVPDSVTVR